MRPHRLAAAALASLAGLGVGTGTALAQSDEDVTITIGPRTVLTAGDEAPFDAPGVRAIRRGRPIPSGYRLIGREVSGGAGGVGAAIRFTCPTGTRLRTFGVTGRVGFTATRDDYVGRRSTIVVSLGPARQSGTIYAVCR